MGCPGACLFGNGGFGLITNGSKGLKTTTANLLRATTFFSALSMTIYRSSCSVDVDGNRFYMDAKSVAILSTGW